MAEIHLYGKLCRYAPSHQPERGCVIRVSPGPDETLETLLASLEIPVMTNSNWGAPLRFKGDHRC